MQLKVKEPENTPENTSGTETQPQNLGGQPDVPGVSNNGYLNDEMDFLAEDGDMFGNQFSQNNGTGNGAGNGPQNYGVPGNSDPEPTSKPRKLTKQEFFNSPRNRKDRDRIIISSIVIIATAIFDVVRVDFWLQALKKQIQLVNDLSEEFGLGEENMIDPQAIMRTQVILSVIFVALGIGIFLFKSRACAITGLAFTVINCLYTIVVAHNFRWYWTIIAFGYAVVATISFNKNWQEYEDHGEWKKDW
ncbi:MAG: hypothetical protein K6F55_03555 [Eubacterium sp.]|nr:hypothetical protein [Eubacterium sp.]